MIFLRRLGLQALLLLPLSAFAAKEGGESIPSAVSFGGMFQVVFSLLLVLAAIAGTAWLLKRFGPSQLGPGGAMKVLGGVAIGPRERLVLVEVGDTWLIVGVAQGHVSAVHSMARPPEATERGAPNVVSSPFAERLKQMLGKQN